MKRDQRLVHSKFQPYLDWLIRGSITNFLRFSIVERNLEITNCKTIARMTQKKLTGRVV